MNISMITQSQKKTKTLNKNVIQIKAKLN